MHLYLTTGKRNHTIICQPGREFPTSDFLAFDGSPLTFSVPFVDGKASNVRDDLARYLLDKELVQRSPIMTDLEMDKRLKVHDERVRTHRILAGV